MTYVNQPAYEIISVGASVPSLFTEVSHEVKHEGPILAYSVGPSGTQPEPSLPDWLLGDQTEQ